jgi:serine/threonine protein kinase
MAPEQFVNFDSFWANLSFEIRARIQDFVTGLGFKHDSRPADVWAMGVTLSAMLLPLPEVTAALAAARAGKKWAPAPGSAAAALPAELRDLLFRGMLARRPRRRLTVAQLKGHAFFAGVDWAAVEARAAPLPIDLVALARRGREAAAAAAAAAAAPSPAAAVPIACA